MKPDGPRPRNPLARLRAPSTPPGNRSREAHGLLAVAASGRFALQVCSSCGRVHYPPQQICRECLGDELVWRDVGNGGELLAETMIHHSNDLYFRERLPWRLGLVKLDAGPSVVVHLASNCARGDRVRLAIEIDRSGNAVMSARADRPPEGTTEDRQLHEMGTEIAGRRVLVVDAKTPLGEHLCESLLAAGARDVYAGYAQGWRLTPSLERLRARPEVKLFPLDVTDTDSVTELGALLGAKVEILINNSYYLRPGGASGRMDLNTTREEMDVHYHGLLRLAGAFAPAMQSRSADGDFGAVAWVNVLSVYALVNMPAFGTYSASQAAALSVSHCLRSELAGAGVRVLNAFLGPIDDEWHQLVPPPKLGADVAARRVVSALTRGGEDVAIGAVAEEVLARFQENPKEVERAIRL